jgi:hypothetical protein
LIAPRNALQSMRDVHEGVVRPVSRSTQQRQQGRPRQLALSAPRAMAFKSETKVLGRRRMPECESSKLHRIVRPRTLGNASLSVSKDQACVLRSQEHQCRAKYCH